MERKGKWKVQAVSPAGLRFSHSFDLFPMTKLVARSLIENGYFEVFIITESGERFGRKHILDDGFEL